MTQPSQPASPTAPTTPKGDLPLRLGFRRHSMVQFLALLALFFVSLPFLEKMACGDVVEAILTTLMLASAVLAVGLRRGNLVGAALLVLPAIAGKWASHYRPDLVAPEVFPISGMVFVGFVVAQFLRFILRSPRVNSEVLCAGISVYLLMGLFWMFAYVLVAQEVPGSFVFNTGPAAGQVMTRFKAYYFSFMTLSTVGYGDITPLSNEARALAVAEAMTGTLFITVLIARLVALFTTQNQTSDTSGRADTSGPKS
jgi:hypothetical protein